MSSLSIYCVPIGVFSHKELYIKIHDSWQFFKPGFWSGSRLLSAIRNPGLKILVIQHRFLTWMLLSKENLFELTICICWVSHLVCRCYSYPWIWRHIYIYFMSLWYSQHWLLRNTRSLFSLSPCVGLIWLLQHLGRSAGRPIVIHNYGNGSWHIEKCVILATCWDSIDINHA